MTINRWLRQQRSCYVSPPPNQAQGVDFDRLKCCWVFGLPRTSTKPESSRAMAAFARTGRLRRARIFTGQPPAVWNTNKPLLAMLHESR